MVAVELRFLAGRYHATPWDHHVNEGVPEWPPSPFRILRALVAASYKRDPRPSEAALADLVSALAPPPVFALPPATTGHTRHYMPIPGTTTKVFDTFVAVQGGAGAGAAPVVVAWPDVTLGSEAEELLRSLLPGIGYLGRAESWVEARLLPDWDGAIDARPAAAGESPVAEIPLLALQPADAYAAWREGFLEAQGKKPKRVPPADLLGALHLDTGRLQKEGWSQPPGTRTVRYALLAEPFRARVAPRRAPVREQPTVARFALSSAVPPRVTEAISIGDRMRQALLSRSRDPDTGISHPVFLGRDAGGAPLRGQRHAFFLPSDDDADGRLDHVLVWSRGGFDGRAVRALQGVERLWGREGHDLHLALVGLGQPDDYGGLADEVDRGLAPQLGFSRVWESRTPVVLPRHEKVRAGGPVDGPEEQVRRGVRFLDLPNPMSVARLDGVEGSPPIRWHQFRRTRLEGGGSQGGPTGFGFRVTFAEPVRGPIAIGYGAHQGLGQFVAVRGG